MQYWFLIQNNWRIDLNTYLSLLMYRLCCRKINCWEMFMLQDSPEWFILSFRSYSIHLTHGAYQEYILFSSSLQILECLKRTMCPKGWCHSVLVVQAGAVFLVLGSAGDLVRQAEAVVAYSTQNQPSVYLGEFTNQKLESFSELWQGIFLWGFFSILFIHIVSAIIAFLMLRRHKYGR